MPTIQAVDLFCGAGGFSAGLIQAGIEVVAAYDHWPVAVETYCRNVGDHAMEADLLDVERVAREISEYDPDLIVGSPPCQDFSTAGKRIEGERANLTVAYADIVARCAPKYFLMENVPQARNSAAYGQMKTILAQRGYDFKECVLDASQYGVPQLRKRFFSFGWKGDHYGDRFASYICMIRAQERLTVKQYLGAEIDIEYYYRHPRNYSRRSVFTVHEPSPTIRGVNRPVPPRYRRNHLDSADPRDVRPLTSWERSRIQTFPAQWDWGANKPDRNADVELLIGNALPVRLAEFIGTGLINVIDKRPPVTLWDHVQQFQPTRRQPVGKE